MHERSRRRDRRVVHRLALLLACAVAALLGFAGPALAAPGLTPLPQIGLPTGPQTVGAMAVHRGAAYAAVVESRGERDELLVRRFDQADDAWQPVAGPLNNSRGSVGVCRVSLLSTHAGELYAAWIEAVDGRETPVELPSAEWRSQGGSLRAVVARLTPDGRSWERIMQTPSELETLALAQVGGQVWVAWDHNDRVRLARITAGHVDAAPTAILPAEARLRGLVGHGDVAYLTHTEYVNVPAHRDNETGNYVPQHGFTRLRVARLEPVPHGARMQLTEIGSWDHAEVAFLTAGTPAAPARPILGWTSPEGIEVMRLRADGTGFDRIPIAPLIRLRRIHELRGIAATTAGTTIAATGRLGAVRVYTITEDGGLTITAGDLLPDVVERTAVTLAPAPSSADPGALVLGYNEPSRMLRPYAWSPDAYRVAAMRYTP